jgi:type IV secretion system protein VirD4
VGRVSGWIAMSTQVVARRAKSQPLLHSAPIRALIFYGLVTVYLCWVVIGVISSGSTWLGIWAPPDPFGRAPSLFILNLWGLSAGALFALIVANPFAWLNGKRLAIGCMALAMMLGRLIAGPLTFLSAYFKFSALILFFTTPLTLLVSGAGVIIALFLAVVAVLFIFAFIPALIFKQLMEFERALHIHRYQARGLSGYIVRGMYWLFNETLPASPPDDSKGARFATIEEVIAIHQPDEPASMAFGHMQNPVFVKTEKHVLIMASTRSGKGVTLIIPHLLRYRGSAFILDPKGENAKATGRCRASLNDEVHYLDPFGISGKPQSRFNPLARFTPDNMEAESKALANALFVVSYRERDHWTAAGQQLLAAIILYVYLSPDIPGHKKDLPTVRKLLLGALKPTLEAMVQMDDADGLLRDLAMSFLETPEREFGSIVSTAQRQTEILDNPFIVACLSATGEGPEVDFSLWRDGTMSVYLCLSAPKFPVFNRWLRLVLTSALDEMTDTLDPPPAPVCFMLDELATLGHLTAVENAVGLAAGYGIQLITVFQDVAQMRELYRGRWASFIGNAGVRALFNLDDYDTAEYWSKFIGGNLVETRSRKENVYGLNEGGESISEVMRPLLSTDKLMMDFASGRMLVLAQGSHPFITDRVAYWDDRYLDGRWDDPRSPVAYEPEPQPVFRPPVAPRWEVGISPNRRGRPLIGSQRQSPPDASR